MQANPECVFCQRSGLSMESIVAGPRTCICDSCLVHAFARMSQTSGPQVTGSDNAVDYCSFCAKKTEQVRCMAYFNTSAICNECVSLVFDILLDRRGANRGLELVPWNADPPSFSD